MKLQMSPIFTTSRRLSGGRMGNAPARWRRTVCYTRSNIFEPIYSSPGFHHRCANPANNTNELLYHLKAAGLPSECVITFDESNQVSVDSLIQQGLRSELNFIERNGRTKAVAISHFASIVNVIQMAEHQKVNKNYAPWEEQRFRPGDVVARDIYGMVLGLSVVVIPKFNFTEFLERPLLHPAVKNYNLNGARHLMSGAAPLSASLVDQLVKVLPNARIGQGYGKSESSSTIAMFSMDEKLGVPGSAGRLVHGVVAKVVKDDGTLAGFYELEALGCLNNEEATKETFVNGWLRTGDEVVMREDHESFVVHRLKEIMKVKGFQVAHAELEGCVLEHPDVSDACVMAFVVLHPNAVKRIALDPAEAMGHVKTNARRRQTCHVSAKIPY
ncbi:hypothetical protein EDD22DRAFT_924011, partial [Suillus occidentalis]